MRDGDLTVRVMLDTTSPATAPATTTSPGSPVLGCTHAPVCPPVSDPAAGTARVRVDHSEQGWELLCNGAIRFDDDGDLIFPRP